jgi:hypothetical protein
MRRGSHRLNSSVSIDRSAAVAGFRSPYTHKMRWRLIAAWAAVTIVLMFMAISDHVFGTRDLKRLGYRLLLALTWPLAILSASGRARLFSSGRNL